MTSAVITISFSFVANNTSPFSTLIHRVSTRHFSMVHLTKFSFPESSNSTDNDIIHSSNRALFISKKQYYLTFNRSEERFPHRHFFEGGRKNRSHFRDKAVISGTLPSQMLNKKFARKSKIFRALMSPMYSHSIRNFFALSYTDPPILPANI